MAAAIGSSQLQTTWALYQSNKTFRYSIYALEIIAIAGLRQNMPRISLAVLGVSVWYLGQKMLVAYPHLQKIYARHPQITLVKQAALVSEITRSLFAVTLICGIILSGWNLSCAWEGGKCLVQGFRNRDLYTCIYALNSLARLGSIWGPPAFFLLEKGDKFFHSTWGEPILSFVENFLKAYKKNEELLFLLPYIEKCQPLFKNNLPRSMALEMESFAHSFPHVYPKVLLKILLMLRWMDIDTPKVIRSKTPTLSQRIQLVVNESLFYGFGFSMVGVRLYYFPIPTLAAFLCGLFCPTQLKSRKDLERRWSRVPDFIEMPWQKKLMYIFDRTNLTLGGIRLGYPGAFLKGLFLAEEFRYYLGPYVKSWCPFIEPLIPTDSRWLFFLGNDFEKITSVEFDGSDYQAFKRKILMGFHPRKLLDLGKKYSVDDIQKAYKNYAKQLHPDIPANSHRQEEATVLFKCLREINTKLRDLLKEEQHMDKNPPATEHSQNSVLDETSQVDQTIIS